MTYEQKKEALNALLRKAVPNGICLAFSGGTDSALLLKLLCETAREVPGTILPVLFDTFLHPSADRKEAERTAAACGAALTVLPVNELENPLVLDNPKDRCYQCKKYLFTKLAGLAKASGCGVIMDGTNYDDTLVYRPGLKALAELGVVSPLKACGFSKEEVRKLAREYRLAAASRPSGSCLATRLPYGTHLDPALLRRIEQGEAALHGLGLLQVRIRLHGAVARIEVGTEEEALLFEKRAEAVRKLKALGFCYITMDLEGFRSGSMDLEGAEYGHQRNAESGEKR